MSGIISTGYRKLHGMVKILFMSVFALRFPLCFNSSMKSRALIFAILITVATLILSGCGYMKMTFKRAHANRWDSLRAQKAAYPESNFIVLGKVVMQEQSDLPVAVVAVSDDLRKDEVVDMFFLNSPSYYTLYLPPGQYRLIAFADLNENRRFETEEAIGRYDTSGILVLEEGEGGVVEGADIHADASRPFSADFRFNKRIRGNLSAMDLAGITKPLDDSLFNQRMGEIGLYDPANFMKRVPSLLYTVEGDRSRIPVLFVHGITGTPANWKHIASRLPEGFHPWFFYYPSGESLEKNAELLYIVMDDILPFEPIIIVSHSMGGLVVKAALDRYSRERRSDYLRMYISIAVPYGGVERASAARMSDVSAPSWLDLIPGSDFLNRYVAGGQMPDHTAFHLIFGYGDEEGRCSDGNIDLVSQLEPLTESYAASVYGYNLSHTDLLTDEAVSERINMLLRSLVATQQEK